MCTKCVVNTTRSRTNEPTQSDLTVQIEIFEDLDSISLKLPSFGLSANLIENCQWMKRFSERVWTEIWCVGADRFQRSEDWDFRKSENHRLKKWYRNKRTLSHRQSICCGQKKTRTFSYCTQIPQQLLHYHHIRNINKRSAVFAANESHDTLPFPTLSIIVRVFSFEEVIRLSSTVFSFWTKLSRGVRCSWRRHWYLPQR